MPHEKHRLQWPAKHLAIGLLLAPTMTYAMNLAERKDSLPLPTGLPGSSATGARPFSWYDTPGLARGGDLATVGSGVGGSPGLSVLNFLAGTNVDTSATGLAGLQLEPLRALKVVAPVTIPWSTGSSGPSAYTVDSLFGSLPHSNVEDDPAALAALARQIQWSGISAKEPKHLASWSGAADSKSQESERVRISYTYVGPKSYVDYAYAQQGQEWRREAEEELRKPSPLFMLPAWAASNLADGLATANGMLLQEAWGTATSRSTEGFVDETQLVNRNLGESSGGGGSAQARGALVNPFHLLDAGLAGIVRSGSQAQVGQWLAQADVETIFSQAGRRALISPEPEYHTSYTEIAGTGQRLSADQMLGEARSFVAGDSTPATLYILHTDEEAGQQAITLLSGLENYAAAASSLTSAGSRQRLARNLKVGKWVVASQHTPYAAIGGAHNGFGMPDPGTLSLLALAGVLCARTRKSPA